MQKTVFLETHNLKNRATGLGTFNYELIKGFSQLDLQNLNLILNSKNPSELKSEFGTSFNYHQYNSLSRLPLFRNRKKYDLWHSVNQNTKIEPYKAKNYLLTIHDVNFVEEDSPEKSNKNKKLFIQKLQKATSISYISAFAKKQTHDFFKVPKVPEYIIHNGNPITGFVDISNFCPITTSDKRFLYSIGDFIPRKNFESIITMMEQIDDFILIISGDNDKAYGQKMKQLIQSKKLQSKVFLTGKVDDIGKQYYMSNCQAFLFPSIREGFGLPPIEAMAFGKPIFLANKTSLPEIGGKDCYYWNSFEPDYMKSVLLDGLHHFETNKEIMTQLMKTRAASFDWKNTAAQYLDVYLEMLR